MTTEHAGPGDGHDLVVLRPQGLYCPPGDFYIDPWRPVERAVITHAHADHARPGHGRYVAARAGAALLRARLGDVTLQELDWGESLRVGGVRLSLHPAGHVLGSAQVRLEAAGRVWVVSGDYKLEPDASCGAAFEPLRCDVFVTESTFGLPVYRWPAQREVFDAIGRWWSDNARSGRASVLYCYALGKAQRLLAGIDASIGPVLVHGAVEPVSDAYRASGIRLPATRNVAAVTDRAELRRALILAPPSAAGTPWMRRIGEHADAFASGWMLLRGARRRRGVDRGFVLSDHADWPGLQAAIAATGAERVIVTHGQVDTMVRWLGERGYLAHAFRTEFGDAEPLAEAA